MALIKSLVIASPYFVPFLTNLFNFLSFLVDTVEIAKGKTNETKTQNTNQYKDKDNR